MSARSEWRGRAGAVVALAALLPLLPVVRAPFMYDDTTLIRDNAWMRGWGELGRAWGQPYWPTTGPDALGLYRPVHVALLAAVWNSSGGAVLAFHLYTLALAALAAVSVWWLARRGADAAAALAGALLFAVHPLHVEAVASAANSSELLVVLFTVLLVSLVRDGDADDAAPERWGHAIALGAAAVAALLSKESGLLALPLALVTAWGWRSSGGAGVARLLRANRRGLALAVGGVAVALLARRAVLGAAIARTSIAAQGLEMDAPSRVVAMLSLWPRIGRMLAWPTALAPYYGPTLIPPHPGPVALVSAVVALLTVTTCVHLARRGDRRPLVAVAWIVLTYLPAGNLLVATGQLLSDRTLYGATAGAALLVAWAADVLPTTTMRRVALAIVAIIAAHDVVATARYATAWTSHRALWARLIEAEPNEHLGYKLAGMDARGRGDRAGAIPLLARASIMAPTDRQIRFEYGQALYDAGQFDAAAATLGTLLRDEDVRREPAFVALYLNAVGRSRGAAAVVAAAQPLLASPSGATAALYTGLALEQLGNRAAADSAYVEGLRRSPGDSALRQRHRLTGQPPAGR